MNPALPVDQILRQCQVFSFTLDNFGIALEVKNKRDLKRDGNEFGN